MEGLNEGMEGVLYGDWYGGRGEVKTVMGKMAGGAEEVAVEVFGCGTVDTGELVFWAEAFRLWLWLVLG